MAAAAALLLLVAASLVLVESRIPQGTQAVMLSTDIGEIKRVKLADGSLLTLDTDTRVEVQEGGRRRHALIHQGRARFDILKTGTPFVIDAGGAAIIADAAVIDIDRAAGQGSVDVRRGTAMLRGAAADRSFALALQQGQAARLSREAPPQRRDPSPGPDWTRGMLQFDGTPLAEAVATANRYSRRHVILSSQVQGLRISGAFRAGDTPGLARALAAAFHLSIETRPNGDLVLAAKN